MRFYGMLCIPLTVLLLCMLAVPAFADGSTVISATVPGTHTVTVSCGAGGQVFVSGAEPAGENVYTADRFSCVTVLFLPDDGCTVGTPVVSGCEESAGYLLGDDFLTFTNVTRDVCLSVAFTAAEEPEPAGTQYPVLLPATDAGHGNVTASRTTAACGASVTLTVQPGAGYEAASVLVVDASGAPVSVRKLDPTHLRFTMPASPVRISVSYDRVMNRTYTACAGGKDCILAPFADISASEHDAFHFCLANGLILPVSDILFGTENSVSRIQLLTMLYRMEGKPAVSGTAVLDGFADIDVSGLDEETRNALVWAVSGKIALGYGDGTFGPDDAVTCEQAAMMLYRYALSKGFGYRTQSGSPVLNGSAWALAGLEWANASGLICGNAFDAEAAAETASVSDCAGYLLRFYEIVLTNRVLVRVTTG